MADHLCTEISCNSYGLPHHCGSACEHDIATEVEGVLVRDWHSELCGCLTWPRTCMSYGDKWRSTAPNTWDIDATLKALQSVLASL